MGQVSARKNLVLLVVIIVLIALGAGAYYVFRTKKISSQASSDVPSITLGPASGSYDTQQTFNLTVNLDTAGQASNGYAAALNYDKTILQVSGTVQTGDIDSGNIQYDPNNGTIDASSGKISFKGTFSETGGFTGNGSIGVVTFQVIASQSASNLTFDQDPSSTFINDAGGASNILPSGGAVGGTYDFTGAVVNKPTVSLSAAPDTITTGASSTLTWQITDATVDQCTATPSGWWATSLNSTSSVTPTTTTTYNLTCTNSAGATLADTKVTVNQPNQPSVSVSASPISIDSGGTSKISWTVANLDQSTCVATPDNWFDKTKAVGEITVSPTDTITYNLVCGSLSDSANLTVTVPGPGPTVTMEANGQTSSVWVDYSNTATLSWATAYAKTCTASGGWSGSEPTSGTFVTSNLTTTTTYTLTCKNSDGKKASSVTVNTNAQTVASEPLPTPMPTSTPIVTTQVNAPSATPIAVISVPTSTPLAYLPNNILPNILPIKHDTANTQQIYAGGVVKGWTMWLFYAVIPLTLTATVVYYMIRRKQKKFFSSGSSNDAGGKPNDIWKNPQF